MEQPTREQTAPVMNRIDPILLAIGALIWGNAFAAQRIASRYIGAFAVNCTRFFIGALVLLPVVLLRKKRAQAAGDAIAAPAPGQQLLGGVLCGLALFVASYLQQKGIEVTTAGKSGFLTALYIVLVPLTGVFLGRKVSLKCWLAVALATAGLYLLCGAAGETFTLSAGELYLLDCALCFTGQILLIDHFCTRMDPILLTAVEFFTAGICNLIPMLLLEQPTGASLLEALWPILFLGFFSCGLAYTFQSLGQRTTPAPLASLLMSLESVFAALAGVVLLHEIPTASEFFGSLLMLAAVVLASRGS